MIGKRFYTMSWFNTKEKKIDSIARETIEEAFEEMQTFMKSIPHQKENEKIDYLYDERFILGENEHNGYVKEDDGTEWFLRTHCYVY